MIDRGLVALLANSNPARNASIQARKQAFALRLWNSSKSITGTAAEKYLIGRNLASLCSSRALRYCDDTPHPEGGRHPAMIAIVQDIAGAPVAVHRTYLQPNGRKAIVEPVKASLGPVWGGAIRLNEHRPDKPLVIAEGIETAAAAGCLMGYPAWAAISAGNLGRGMLLPTEVRRVCIAADPDDAGRHAARDAWQRWRAELRDAEDGG